MSFDLVQCGIFWHMLILLPLGKKINKRAVDALYGVHGYPRILLVQEVLYFFLNNILMPLNR